MKSYRLLIYLFFIAIISIIWQLEADKSNSIRMLISSPSLIWDYFKSNCNNLFKAAITTTFEAISGLILACIFSFAAIITCFYFSKLLEYILPIMIFSQVIPLITLAPLFIILFGSGVTAKIMMASLLCFFPIFINFANGVKLINISIHELMFIYGANTTQKIKYVYFPLLVPNIMTGLKIAATLSVIGAIVAEFNGADIGIGKNLFLAAKSLEPELMMCSLFLSSAMGTILYLTIYLIELKLGKWYLN
jgi:ABC-type nitrate/sulfonate/bicarbonate transport system permease component